MLINKAYGILYSAKLIPLQTDMSILLSPMYTDTR